MPLNPNEVKMPKKSNKSEENNSLNNNVNKPAQVSESEIVQIFKVLVGSMIVEATKYETLKNADPEPESISRFRNALMVLLEERENVGNDIGILLSNDHYEFFWGGGLKSLFFEVDTAENYLKKRVGRPLLNLDFALKLYIELERFKGKRLMIDKIGNILKTNGALEQEFESFRIYNRDKFQSDLDVDFSFLNMPTIDISDKQSLEGHRWEHNAKPGIRKAAFEEYKLLVKYSDQFEKLDEAGAKNSFNEFIKREVALQRTMPPQKYINFIKYDYSKL